MPTVSAAQCPFCGLSHPIPEGRFCRHSDTVAYPRGCPGSGLTLVEARRGLDLNGGRTEGLLSDAEAPEAVQSRPPAKPNENEEATMPRGKQASQAPPPKKRNRGRWYLVTGYEGYDTKAQMLAALAGLPNPFVPPPSDGPLRPAPPSAIIHGHLLILKPVTRYELAPAPKEQP